MLNKVDVKIKQVSLFPFKSTKNSDNKIYVKHFIYLISLIELNNEYHNIKIILKKNHFIFKKKTKKVQVLRSPNRHKVAQFHVSRRNFFLLSSIQLIIPKVNTNIFFLINYFNKTLLSFESSSIFIKNIKINYHTNLYLNKIYFLNSINVRLLNLSVILNYVYKNKKNNYLIIFLQYFSINLLKNYFYKTINNRNYIY